MTDQAAPDCVFCPVYERPKGDLFFGRGSTPVLRWPHIKDVLVVREASNGLRHAVAVPLEPVVTGHLLVIPETHVPDAGANPSVTGGAFEVAAAHAASAFDFFNLIANTGKPASQSVFHLHVHIIPRSSHDGLQLPWTGQKRSPRPPADLTD